MKSIVYVGMDVHKENYTLSSYSIMDTEAKYKQKMKPEIKMVMKYLGEINRRYGEDVEIICGYEAGSIGYSLYNQLTNLVVCKV